MNRLLARFSPWMFAASLAMGCGAKKDVAPAPASAATADPAPAPAAPPPADNTAAAPTGGKEYTTDEVCDKSISMIEAMAEAVVSNKDNCDAMGDALQKWVDDNKDFIAWGKAHDQDAAMKKEFEEKCMPKMSAMLEKVGGAMAGAQACADNAKVKAALASLD